MNLLVASDRGNGRFLAQITHKALIEKFKETADEKVDLIVKLFDLEMSVPKTKDQIRRNNILHQLVLYMDLTEYLDE